MLEYVVGTGSFRANVVIVRGFTMLFRSLDAFFVVLRRVNGFFGRVKVTWGAIGFFLC